MLHIVLTFGFENRIWMLSTGPAQAIALTPAPALEAALAKAIKLARVVALTVEFALAVALTLALAVALALALVLMLVPLKPMLRDQQVLRSPFHSDLSLQQVQERVPLPTTQRNTIQEPKGLIATDLLPASLMPMSVMAVFGMAIFAMPVLLIPISLIATGLKPVSMKLVGQMPIFLTSIPMAISLIPLNLIA